MGKTAAIYNPYLDTLGGGEKYTLTFAKVLAEEGYDVDVEWKDESILESISNRFGLKFPKNIKVVDTVNRGENYDLCFWVSDGSIPTLRARKNYIHFQIPFHDVNGKTLINKMKLFRVDKNISNSIFTKKVIDKEYGVNSDVLYPPVSVDLFKPRRKENQICYVGRFSALTQNKGQDILIEQFKTFVKNKKYSDWKLILAGGVEVGSDINIKRLKELADGYNIEFIESPKIDVIKEIYGKSKIFWSGAGYGVDENINPQQVEHFGITLVESMSAGCVPVAFNIGGPREIIENGINGFLWNSTSELIEITERILGSSKDLKELSKFAIQTSKKYAYEEFKNNVLQIIK